MTRVHELTHALRERQHRVRDDLLSSLLGYAWRGASYGSGRRSYCHGS